VCARFDACQYSRPGHDVNVAWVVSWFFTTLTLGAWHVPGGRVIQQEEHQWAPKDRWQGWTGKEGVHITFACGALVPTAQNYVLTPWP